MARETESRSDIRMRKTDMACDARRTAPAPYDSQAFEKLGLTDAERELYSDRDRDFGHRFFRMALPEASLPDRKQQRRWHLWGPTLVFCASEPGTAT